MWAPIFLTVVFGYLAASENAYETGIARRYYFPNPGGMYACVSRKRELGRCVPLSSCPFLKDVADHVPRMYLLSAVSEYICGLSDWSVRVCCPNGRSTIPLQTTRPPQQRPRQTTVRPTTTRRPPTKQPLVDSRQPTGNSNWWQTTPATARTQPTPRTSQSPRKTTTNHRNRRLLPNECGIEFTNKIIGGKGTALDEFPWMALLRFSRSNTILGYFCGGSLINSRYILTAAHCFSDDRLPDKYVIDQVRLGEHDLTQELDCVGSECSEPPADIEVEEQIVHPKYSPRDPSSQNDIALIRLKRPAKFSRFIQPICLPLDDLSNKDLDGQKMWTAGWGKTTNEAYNQSAVKQKVQLPVVPFRECAPIYLEGHAKLTENQICAGGRANEDACHGDSGGPLMRQDFVGSTIRWHVQGVVSFGPVTCGKDKTPAIYIKVGKYLDWILDNMRD